MSVFVELPEICYRTELSKALVVGRYDFQTARALAFLSQLAYETAHPDKIGTVLDRWGLSLAALLKQPSGGGVLPIVDTRALVIDAPAARIVAFAGTDPLVPANWLTDFNTLPGPEDIHTGFAKGVEAVWRELRSAIAAGGWVRPIFVTGHSLGGALAVIAAKLLHDAGIAEIGAVYTFGMPRCGGSRFAAAYDRELGQRTFRLVHGDDIVPSVPPVALGFCHVGQVLATRRGGLFEASALPAIPAGAEATLLAAVLRSARDALQQRLDPPPPTQPGRLGQAYRFLPPAIADHIPSAYLTALGFRLSA